MCEVKVLTMKSEWVLPGGTHEIREAPLPLDWVRGADEGDFVGAPPPPPEARWGYYEEVEIIHRAEDHVILWKTRWRWSTRNGSFIARGGEWEIYRIDLDRGITNRIPREKVLEDGGTPVLVCECGEKAYIYHRGGIAQ